MASSPANVVPAPPQGWITCKEASRRTGWTATAFNRACIEGEIKPCRLLFAKNRAFKRWVFPEATLLGFFKSPKRRALPGQPGSVEAVIKKLEAGDISTATTHAATIRSATRKNGRAASSASAADTFTQALVALVRSAVRAELATAFGDDR